MTNKNISNQLLISGIPSYAFNITKESSFYVLVHKIPLFKDYVCFHSPRQTEHSM